MIKLDTSHSEPVLLGTEKRQLIHRYGISTVTSSVTCLTLDELLAEKYVAMCDVLSRREQDVRQSTRPRDYFDFDQVLAEHGIENKENFLSAILIKAKRRQVEVRSLNELLSPQAVAKLETDWRPFLSQVVPGLSDCRAAVTRMEEKMQKIFPDFAGSLAASKERASELKAKS